MMVSFALRLAVTRLLSGNTWAGTRIMNSPLDPIAEVLEGGHTTPLIAVFTNDEMGKGHEGRDWGGRSRDLDIVLFIYLPPAMVTVPNGAGTLSLENRSAGGATVLDLVAHQCRVALRNGPMVWRQVYEGMTIKITEERSRPILVETEKSIRIPSKEITLSMSVVPEPPIGQPIAGWWLALDAAMRADPDAAPLADLIKTMIEAPIGLSSWQDARLNTALSEGAIRSLGIAPMDPTETGEAALLTDIDTPGENTVVAPESLP